MGCYNSEKSVGEAVDSILAQTFRDFEFIVVDDGSTDRTPEILAAYTDPRLVRVMLPSNQGLAIALNRGLAVAQGEYVARMDADDVSVPERLAKQVAHMDAHPEIGVLGGFVQRLDELGRTKGKVDPPTAHAEIAWQLYFYSTNDSPYSGNAPGHSGGGRRV